MTNNSFLSRDALFHNRTETMTLEQLCRFDTMLRINHIVNCALTSDDRERSSGRCLTMQFSDFIEKLRKAFEATIKQESICDDILVFDDFIRIADFSYAAMKEIITNPSTRIEKIDTKVNANRATGFSNKTMRWMSQRPGRTIEEKISPENKVLTTRTVFSADTKENQEFIYLYKIIYEAVSERIKDTKCQSCSLQSRCDYYEWVLKVKKLLAMNIKIKTGDLANIKPIKQQSQNNKLMCDKNYKIIWDAVQMLSHVEEKIEKDYNSNLTNRLATILYWLILGKLNSLQGILIKDYAGALQDEDGVLWFGGREKNLGRTSSTLIQTDRSGCVVQILSLSLNSTIIELRNESQSLFSFNIEDYFTEISSAIAKQYWMALEEATATGTEK